MYRTRSAERLREIWHPRIVLIDLVREENHEPRLSIARLQPDDIILLIIPRARTLRPFQDISYLLTFLGLR